MEKAADDSRTKKWVWANEDDRDLFHACCSETTCWACRTYSRTKLSLELAASGQNVKDASRQDYCNPHCTYFALAFPFYGCFLASLQSSVRSFYGIEGKYSQDCYDGCFCPCPTLVRNQQEIIVREKKYKASSKVQTPRNRPENQYQCHPPMVYVNKSRELSIPTPEISRPGNSGDVSSIPEDNSDTRSNVVPNVPELGRVHSLKDDDATTTRTPKQGHEIRFDLTTPMKGRFQEHILDTDAESVAPSSKPSSHDLIVDSTTVHRTGPSKHELGWDPSAPEKPTGTTHKFQADAVLSIRENSSHSIDSHVSFVDAPISPAAHNLKEDEAMTIDDILEAPEHEIQLDEETSVARLSPSHELGA